MSAHAVLLLNADYSPIKVIPWEKAVCLLIDEKVRLVQGYVGKVLHSASKAMEWPAVVALKRYANVTTKVRFNRANLLARDAYTCAYCGITPKGQTGSPNLEMLTLDHVVPRAQSKGGMVTLPWNKQKVSVTCWENVVCACADCNSKKADRTPGQAGLKLKSRPRKPNAWDCVRMTLARMRIPEEWKSFVPADSAWRDYWDTELDAD